MIQKGDTVRMSQALREELKASSPEHEAEFGECVGTVEDPPFPDDPDTVDVRWQPSGLRYMYDINKLVRGCLFKLIDESNNTTRSITLSCSLKELDEFIDSPEFEEFIEQMECGKTEWCGVHDFVGDSETFMGYTSYEIKNHDLAIEKWKEFFQKHHKI